METLERLVDSIFRTMRSRNGPLMVTKMTAKPVDR